MPGELPIHCWSFLDPVAVLQTRETGVTAYLAEKIHSALQWCQDLPLVVSALPNCTREADHGP